MRPTLLTCLLLALLVTGSLVTGCSKNPVTALYNDIVGEDEPPCPTKSHSVTHYRAQQPDEPVNAYVPAYANVDGTESVTQAQIAAKQQEEE